VTNRSAPATAAKPATNGRLAPQVIARPLGVPPQRFKSNLPRTIAQSPANLQRTYWPITRTSSPNLAALSNQGGGPVQQPISVDPVTRQTELRTLAAMHQRRGIVTREGNIVDPAPRENEVRTLTTMREQRGLVTGQVNTLDSATRETELRTLQKMHEHRGFGTDNRTLATIDPQRHITDRDPEAGPQRETPE